MPDLVYDGTDVFARVVWKLGGGRVIDPGKVMLVDTGAPFTGISISNVAPELRIAGLTSVQILGCVGGGVILKGGQMRLTIDGEERVCAKPVVYSPCFLNDILGADQVVDLGLMPGLVYRPPPRTRRPVVGFDIPLEFPLDLEPDMGPVGTGFGTFLMEEMLTLAPGVVPFSQTPRPGLFSFAGPLPSQGEYASAAMGWSFGLAWPGDLPAGRPFEVLAGFLPDRDLDFAAVTFEVPYGFQVLEGEPSLSIPAPRAGRAETIRLRLRAADAAADHFFGATVRVGLGEEQESRAVAGRLAVRGRRSGDMMPGSQHDPRRPQSGN